MSEHPSRRGGGAPFKTSKEGVADDRRDAWCRLRRREPFAFFDFAHKETAVKHQTKSRHRTHTHTHTHKHQTKSLPQDPML
jgi:hypothetical protein